LAGEPAAARGFLAALQETARTRFVDPYDQARVLVGLGEHELAFARLDEAVAVRSEQLLYLAHDPQFAPLRFDPRFAQLTGRITAAQGHTE
jgi:hypothetical protein